MAARWLAGLAVMTAEQPPNTGLQIGLATQPVKAGQLAATLTIHAQSSDLRRPHGTVTAPAVLTIQPRADARPRQPLPPCAVDQRDFAERARGQPLRDDAPFA